MTGTPGMYVVRSASTAPGAESWLQVGDDSVVIVSADGVTEDGAEYLEDAWRYFIDKGLWRRTAGRGQAFEVVYARVELPEGIAVRVTSAARLVTALLDPEYFTDESVRGLHDAVSACARSGWRQHEPFPAAKS